MKYFLPLEVVSPKDYISNVQVLYDGGKEFVSVVSLEWEGETQLAMRWNVARNEWNDTEKRSGKKKCVGMPSSHGKPVWFILPKELFDFNSDLHKAIESYLKI